MRIVIAEDAALIREGLKSLLHTAGHDVVAAINGSDHGALFPFALTSAFSLSVAPAALARPVWLEA